MYIALYVLIFLSLFSFIVALARQADGYTMGVVLNILLCAGWLTAVVYLIDQI